MTEKQKGMYFKRLCRQENELTGDVREEQSNFTCRISLELAFDCDVRGIILVAIHQCSMKVVRSKRCFGFCFKLLNSQASVTGGASCMHL